MDISKFLKYFSLSTERILQESVKKAEIGGCILKVEIASYSGQRDNFTGHDR